MSSTNASGGGSSGGNTQWGHCTLNGKPLLFQKQGDNVLVKSAAGNEEPRTVPLAQFQSQYQEIDPAMAAQTMPGGAQQRAAPGDETIH